MTTNFTSKIFKLEKFKAGVKFFKTEPFMNGVLLGVLVLIVIAHVARAYSARYSLGIDTISYVSISKHYLNLNFEYAINAYWSPMVSWLMAPLLAIGLTGSEAFLVINISASIALIFGGLAFIKLYLANNKLLMLIFIIVAAPFTLRNASTLMPDLLLAAWSVWFVVSLIWLDRNAGDIKSRKYLASAGIVGLIGVIGYFTKLYALPVYIFTMIALAGIEFLGEFLRGKDSKIRMISHARSGIPYLIPVIITIALMAPWVVALSVKYGKPMVGSSGTNVSNQFNRTDFLEANDRYEILAPPNPDAYLIAEDRTSQWTIEKSEWEQNLGRKGKLLLFISRIESYIEDKLNAFPFYLNRITSMWPATLPVIWATGIALLLNIVKVREHKYIFIPWMFVVIYLFGYALVTNRSSGGGNVRYYWPIFIISAILFLSFLPRIWRYLIENTGRARQVVFVFIVVVTVWLSPAHYVYGLNYIYHIRINNPLSFGSGGQSSVLKIFSTPGKSYDLQLAEDIINDGVIKEGSQLISNNYRRVARLSYYTESQAYGRSGLKYDYTDMVLREKMKDMGVDYYIHFSPIPEEDREVRAILALSGVDSEHVEIEEGATTSQQIQEELEGEFDARGIGEEDSMVDLSQLSQDEIDWLRVYAKPLNLHEGDEVVAEYERVIGCSDLRSPVWRPCRIQVVKLR